MKKPAVKAPAKAAKPKKETAPPIAMDKRLGDMHRKLSTVAGGLAFSMYKRTFSKTVATEWLGYLKEVETELKELVK